MVIGYSYRAMMEEKMPVTTHDRDMLEAECYKLRAIKYELLAALVDTVGVARRALTYNGTDIEVVDNRLKNALAAIARAEGKQ